MTPANVSDAKGLKHICPNKGAAYADKGYCTQLARHAAAKLSNNVIMIELRDRPRNDVVSGKPDVQHTLKTIRYKLLAKAGYITKDSRKKIINLAIAMRQCEWIEGLWNKSKSFDLPVIFTTVFSP